MKSLYLAAHRTGQGHLPPALPQMRETHSTPVGRLPGAAVAAVLAAAGVPFSGPGAVTTADGGLCYQQCHWAKDEKKYGGGAHWAAAAASAAAAHGRRGTVSRAGPQEGQRWRAGWRQPLAWARAGWGWPLALPWASWDPLAAAVVLQGKRKHAIFALDISDIRACAQQCLAATQICLSQTGNDEQEDINTHDSSVQEDEESNKQMTG
jgi:hypothetical protein